MNEHVTYNVNISIKVSQKMTNANQSIITIIVESNNIIYAYTPYGNKHVVVRIVDGGAFRVNIILL